MELLQKHQPLFWGATGWAWARGLLVAKISQTLPVP